MSNSYENNYEIGDLVKITSKGHLDYDKVCLIIEKDNTLYKLLCNGEYNWFHYKEFKRNDTE